MSHLLGRPDPTGYTVNQMSYDVARLRLNGLITRRPRTNTCQLTPTGKASRPSTPRSTTGSCDL